MIVGIEKPLQASGRQVWPCVADAKIDGLKGFTWLIQNLDPKSGLGFRSVVSCLPASLPKIG